MTDVLRLALNRRAELTSELAGLDKFVRMAEELISGAQRRGAQQRPSAEAPAVDPFQALFNSGEVLPPLPSDDKGWAPLDAGGVFVRTRPGWD